jgi:hypothetical protein
MGIKGVAAATPFFYIPFGLNKIIDYIEKIKILRR